MKKRNNFSDCIPYTCAQLDRNEDGTTNRVRGEMRRKHWAGALHALTY